MRDRVMVSITAMDRPNKPSTTYTVSLPDNPGLTARVLADWTDRTVTKLLAGEYVGATEDIAEVEE